MRLLLDSHVFLWWQSSAPQLDGSVVETIASADEVFVSAATTCELGLKSALGKLHLPEPVEDAVLAAGFTELPVSFAHTRAAVALPMHHRDPFDRILIAQAVCEKLTLVTADEQLQRYDATRLPVHSHRR